jgi:hypothetical protein
MSFVYCSNVNIHIYETESSQTGQIAPDVDALDEISLNPISIAYSALQKQQRTEMRRVAHSCTEDEQADGLQRKF